MIPDQDSRELTLLGDCVGGIALAIMSSVALLLATGRKLRRADGETGVAGPFGSQKGMT